MKIIKDTIIVIKEKEMEENSNTIEKLSKIKKAFVWIKKTNENKIELFWNKTLDNIILIGKVENYFKNLYSVVNPSAQFIKKSMNRNINTTKSFYRINKKSTVIDIGFFSAFIKELNNQVINETHSISKSIKEILWIVDYECIKEYEKQYSEEEILQWFKDNEKIFNYKPFDHQIKAVVESLKYRKRLIKSNTGTGKSFNFVLIHAFYKQKYKNLKTLIIVPFVQLINQLSNEFLLHFPDIKILKIGGDNQCNFGYGEGEYININKTKYDLVISTYQSLPTYKEDLQENVKKFLHEFGHKNEGLLIIDETHKAKASTIQDILNNMPNCKFRVGMTGTIANSQENCWDIWHLYSKFRYQYVEVTEIVDMEQKGILTPAEFHFNIIKGYSEIEKYMKKSYAEEIDLIANSEERLNKIFKYTIDNYEKNKNTLLFFNRKIIGENLYYKLKENKDLKEKTFIITGETPSTLRESIKDKIENSYGNLICASFGTTATGINFKNVEKMYVLEMKKSDIIIFQSIGRMQRVLEGKEKVDIYFFIDKFFNYNNYMYTHLKNFVIPSLKREFGEERILKDIKNNTKEI